MTGRARHGQAFLVHLLGELATVVRGDDIADAGAKQAGCPGEGGKEGELRPEIAFDIGRVCVVDVRPGKGIRYRPTTAAMVATVALAEGHRCAIAKVQDFAPRPFR